MENLYQVPVQAIAAFEAISGLTVSVHDRAKSLLLILPPERFWHQSPLCKAVKAAGHEQTCVRFDAQQTHEDLLSKPEGRVQICFAGLVECAVPVFFREKLEWVLFAGPRMPSAGLTIAERDTQAPASRAIFAKWPNPPKAIQDAEARNILELLRQLAARLLKWREEFEQVQAIAPSKPSGIFQQNPLTHRRAVIAKIIHDQHRSPLKLSDVARALHLSESRAGHAVKEACGATFISLLTQARLRTAAGLLRHTTLSIRDVAARSGFDDVSHFHAVFRRHFKSTPRQHRKSGRES